MKLLLTSVFGPYGVDDKYHWIDSFHTGYVLESLYMYIKYTNDYSCEKHLVKGYDYFVRNFFLPNGIPKYYNNRKAPLDIQWQLLSI